MRAGGRVLVVALAAVLLQGPAWARSAHTPHKPHHPHHPRQPRAPKPPPPPQGGSDDGGGTTAVSENAHLVPLQLVELPGRGTTLAWAPDGRAIAVGGHFAEKSTGLRYDTRIYDVARNTLVKSFACHYYWVVSLAWTINPYVGEVIADGGADHAVKVWDANGPGSLRCRPGQLQAADGGILMLPDINGWVTSLAFSPDGRHLAAASRDRTVRVWQVAPGAEQWQVVALWYEAKAGNFVSLDWAPDGRSIVTGDRRGRVMVWSFDPDADRWPEDMVAAYRKVSWKGQQTWVKQERAYTFRSPRWSDEGHRVVWRARYSPDGTRIAASGEDGVVSVLDAATGQAVFRTGAPRRTKFHGLDWTPDGRHIAAGAADNRIYVFDAATGALYDVLGGHKDDVTAVAWSPDGTTLASVGGGPLLSMATHSQVTGPDQTLRLWTWK
jgi:WD40 repeat protein